MARRPFTDTIAALNYGAVNDELSAEMQKLVDACDKTGKSGSLTLTLKVKPGKAGQMEIVDEFKLKLPTFNRPSTLMYSTPEGNLTRNDPRQMSIEGLREVDKSTGEIKEVANG